MLEAFDPLAPGRAQRTQNIIYPGQTKPDDCGRPVVANDSNPPPTAGFQPQLNASIPFGIKCASKLRVRVMKYDRLLACH